MQLTKMGSALGALLVIVFVITALSAKQDPKVSQKTPAQKQGDWIMYYWFDASNNYLYRQNLVSDEEDITGFNQMFNYPSTLQEKGFAPSACAGDDPPVPFNPYQPSVRLYSHP